jgi:phage repressor protein C with HTH and peptisase S24 domain
MELCGRLAALRERVFGPRGRAALARAIGVSPSTYNYYEKGRTPPADLLAKAAEVTGADLTWLMTGAGEPFPADSKTPSDTTLSQQAQDVLARFLANGQASPETLAARAGLRALLVQLDRTIPAEKNAWRPSAGVKPTAVPILGRTAAGVPAAWERFFAGKDASDVLERMIGRVEAKAARERGAALAAADPSSESQRPQDATALLVQLSAPTPEGVVEFLELPGLGAVGPGAFALRVDGDSMAPRLRDGDLVVCRRDVPPQPGQTAVVQVRGQIGLTVKLWRPEGETVHLIPINEAYQPSRLLRRDLLWACRVLWVVRL